LWPPLKDFELYVLDTKTRVFREWELISDIVSEQVKDDHPTGTGTNRLAFCGTTKTSLNVTKFQWTETWNNNNPNWAGFQ